MSIAHISKKLGRAPLRSAAALGLLVTTAFFCSAPYAQQRSGRAAAARTSVPAQSPRARAPYDLTGNWVSLVTQNWRYRMVVPARGDYAGIPINARGEQFANTWNAASDVAAGKQCEAYGAPILMQIPERLQISWQDDETLRVDTDAGRQTRLLHFMTEASATTLAASLQGYSTAHWQLFSLANSFGADAGPATGDRYGSLVVSTDHLLPGLLRRNGVPYGPQTHMSEYWKEQALDGEQWLMISTSVKDPEYLSAPYVYDSIFQREPNASQRDPSACSLGNGR